MGKQKYQTAQYDLTESIMLDSATMQIALCPVFWTSIGQGRFS